MKSIIAFITGIFNILDMSYFAIIALTQLTTPNIANAASPPLISLNVGLVRISPTRPGTKQTWAVPGRPADNVGCSFFSSIAGAGGLASGGAGLVAGPLVKSLFCSDPGSKTTAHSESDPNIYVRLSSNRLVFRSNTATRTRSHNFNFRIIAPAEAIPTSGLVLEVINDDGSGREENQETIGQVRLHLKDLIASAKSGNPIQEKDNGVEKMEIVVTSAEAGLRKSSQTVDVQKGLAAVPDLTVNAGEVIEVQAHGAYRVAGMASPATALGYKGAGKTYPDSPFSSAPIGAGMIRIGTRGLMEGHLVTPCTSFISPFDNAQLAVGINNGVPGSARGDLSFDVTARPATPDEWRSGKATNCTPTTPQIAELPNAPATSLGKKAELYLQGQGNSIAAAIIKRLHPTGQGASLQAVEARDSDAGTSVQILSSWKGGLLGKPYITMVRWEFTGNRHIGTFVEKDTAQIISSDDARRALDKYFKETLYPKVIK